MVTAATLGSVQSELQHVEDRLAAIADEVEVPLLGHLLRHVLSGRGKRVRPALAFLCARFYQYPIERLIRLATAVELLHTASLIHDDLVDEANVRRGVATLHTLTSPKATVLVGDYLFAKSAALATSTESLAVMALFARTLMAICDGELREISDAADQDRTIERYYRRLEGKTASLFVAATEGGAILSEAPPEVIAALRDYGLNLGMAFQIADDLLDYVGSEGELGKPVGGDLRQGTLTLPALWVLENGPPGNAVARALEAAPPSDELVAEAVALVRASEAVTYTQRRAEGFAEHAKAAMASLPDVAAKQALIELADYAVRRRY